MRLWTNAIEIEFNNSKKYCSLLKHQSKSEYIYLYYKQD